MSLDMNNIEKIEDFMAGRLSTEESSQIQSLIETDPLLQNEANLQKDIINGIQEKRKLELKSRLNNLTVKSVSNTKYYIAAASVATILLGWVVFDNYGNKTPKISKLDSTEISKTEDQVAKVEIGESNIPVNIIEETSITENSDVQETNNTGNSDNITSKKISAIAHPDLGLLPADADQLDDASNVGDIDIESENLPKSIGKHNNISDRISVKTSQSTEKHMRYTYVNETLILVGPWSHKYPYELTDLGSDHELTLEFKGKTYKLKKGLQDAPLKPSN